MPLYEYKCPQHGTFEAVCENSNTRKCPDCGKESIRMLSVPGLIRVHHTDKLPPNHPLRVEDRQKMLKDTAVQRDMRNFQESQLELAKAGKVNP
jgi:putative FmdB family regulatory protein